MPVILSVLWDDYPEGKVISLLPSWGYWIFSGEEDGYKKRTADVYAPLPLAGYPASHIIILETHVFC